MTAPLTASIDVPLSLYTLTDVSRCRGRVRCVEIVSIAPDEKGVRWAHYRAPGQAA